MSTLTSSAQDMKDGAEAAAMRASPYMAKLVRLGYAAKGFVYFVVGLLAVFAAFSAGSGDSTGSRGAMHAILEKPFGRTLLVIVAVGLAAYALWQFFRAAKDPEHSGKMDRKGFFRRAGYLVSGIIHVGLVVAAIRMVTGTSGGDNEDQSARGWTATIMSYPMGQWAVAIAGLIIAGYGLRQIYKGYKTDLDKQLSFGQISPTWRKTAITVSRLGMIARGIVFTMVGVFLVVAARQEDPNEARGLGGALDTLQRQPYGPWLLGAVALGLMAYGVYLFIRARYRWIEVT